MPDPYFEDKELVCSDCEMYFMLAGKEQKWFWLKKMTMPKRCVECREKRRAEREAQTKESNQ